MPDGFEGLSDEDYQRLDDVEPEEDLMDSIESTINDEPIQEQKDQVDYENTITTVHIHSSPDEVLTFPKGSKEIIDKYKELVDESIPKYYVSNREKPRLTGNKIEFVLNIGMRGSGKTYSIEQDMETLYKKGITCLYLWGARSNENVCIAVNRRCKERWENEISDLQSLYCRSNIKQRKGILDLLATMKTSLHCNCHKAYPINWLVPSYWEFKGVWEYNNCWSGKDEYMSALRNKWITKEYYELTLKERDLLDQRKLPKPKYLIKTDLIRICPFTVPVNAKTGEEFNQQFVRYLLEARKEKRWLVMNPQMFINAKHKFATITYIIKHMQYWTEEFFQPNTELSVAKLRGQTKPVPKSDWSKYERHWHQLALAFSEMRTLAPTNKYSPETESSPAKRSIVDIAAEVSV